MAPNGVPIERDDMLLFFQLLLMVAARVQLDEFGLVRLDGVWGGVAVVVLHDKGDCGFFPASEALMRYGCLFGLVELGTLLGVVGG